MEKRRAPGWITNLIANGKKRYWPRDRKKRREKILIVDAIKQHIRPSFGAGPC
jgi:hypothetical protein